MPSPRARIVVIGAGPGGLTLAIALRQAGFDPVVCERSRSGAEAGAAFTLWPNAIQAFDVLGLGPDVRSLCQPLDGIAMLLRDGSELFRLDQATMQASFGGTGWALRRGELIDLLLQHLGGEHVRYGSACLGFTQSAGDVTAYFRDGSEVTGAALIGADGLRSTIRGQMFSSRELRYAGYSVWRGIARLKLAGNPGLTSLGRGQQFGMFPMSSGHIYWFASRNAREGERDAPCGRKAELLHDFTDWHKPVLEVIEATDEASILRTDVYDMEPLPNWTVGRVALLGDAAHPATPDLGQGACQAIEDAVVLAGSLQRGSDPVAALKNYESLRIDRARSLTLQARRMGQAGTWTNPLACGFRNWMIRHTPKAIHLNQLKKVFAFENRSAAAETLFTQA